MKQRNFIFSGIIIVLLAISVIAFRNNNTENFNIPTSTCCQKTLKDCLQQDLKTNRSEIYMESLSRQIILNIPLIH